MKKMVILSSLSLLLLSFSSCTFSTNSTRIEGNFLDKIKLDNTEGVFIALPKAASDGGTTYEDSGSVTQTALRIALEKHVKTIYLGFADEEFEAAVNTAILNDAGYLFYPRIVQWDPDKIITITLEMIVYDVKTGETIYDNELYTRSNDTGLLINLFEQFVANFY